MPTQIIYPKVSLEASTGRVSRWLVSEGDTVRRGQVLFEIENDKAAVEVDAPGDGVIGGLVDAETEVEVGAQVALIYADDEVPARTAPRTAEPPATGRRSMPATLETVASPVTAAGQRPTPLARRIARERSVSLDGLDGTGPRGRVQKKDVLDLLARLTSRPQPSPAISTTGAALHHAWLRRAEGVPLVLLHGFAGDLNSWRGLFAGSRFDGPVLALDLPAHGRSPSAVPADMDALASQIEQSLDMLIAGEMVLVGHSFGGAVAARLAARGVLSLRGLCLFAPAGLGPEINAAFTDGILRARGASSLRPWLNELVHDESVFSDAFLESVVEQRGNEDLTESMRAFANRFLPDGTQRYSILGDLARISLPTRVVFGRNDRILPFARTASLPGHVALHALDGCGHMPQLEHPTLALRILSELKRGD